MNEPDQRQIFVTNLLLNVAYVILVCADVIDPSNGLLLKTGGAWNEKCNDNN